MSPGVKETEEAMGSDRGKAVRSNFRKMSLCFAVNHGCSTAPLIFASSLLDPNIAYDGNGVLYLVSVLSTILLAVVAIDMVGLKGGLLLGTLLYAIYVACFTGALIFVEMQAYLFIGGSVCCGLAAGILWTAEGGYMAVSADELAASDSIAREAATSELAAEFAFWYLLTEVAGKLLFSFLQVRKIMEVGQIGMLFTVMSVVSMCCLLCIDDLKREPKADAREAAGKKGAFDKLFAAVRLWTDPRIWLLSPTNITFGFSAAYLNGYFNARFEVPELGVEWLGTLCAVTGLCCAVLSKVYGILGSKFGKGVPIAIGACSFGGIPLLVLSLGCCKGWGWNMIIFYVLQGSGRAVYESTNKAVFSDYFPGDKSEGAFANCAMQSSVASAALFFASGRIDGQHLATMVMISAVITPFVYLLAAKMNAEAPASPDQSQLNLEENEGME